MSDEDKIAPTAHYTAYAWHRLGLPYADRFVTPKGAALFWSFRAAGEWLAAAAPGVPSMLDYLAQRHLAIEHALEHARPDRIVEIGAGLSRRGVTWALDRDVDFVEIDLPHMVEAKRARIEERFSGLEQQRLARRFRSMAHDVLAPDFAERLRELLAGAERAVVIAEGVIGYFEPRDRERLARAIASALPARGVFTFDARSGEGGAAIRTGARFLKAGIKLVTRGRGVRDDFRGLEGVRSFLLDAGFAFAEPIDLANVAGAPRVPSPARVWRASRSDLHDSRNDHGSDPR